MVPCDSKPFLTQCNLNLLKALDFIIYYFINGLFVIFMLNNNKQITSNKLFQIQPVVSMKIFNCKWLTHAVCVVKDFF